ncbi:MAG: hypothetical protein DSZ05_02495 [Sulfurospirillum sp.]|nr:MAG: hypothetical protein DSZ05_02495 [Sulfurospirillum sp.]
MLQKGGLCLTLFASLLICPALLGKGITTQRLHELSHSHYWRVLLHMKEGKSDIDDASFFLTDTEHFSAERELEATIQQIEDQNETIACRYPARIYWLKQNVPELFTKKKFVCEEVERRIEKEHIQGVTLVFPTAYLNSPASMFGHTFLRLDRDLATPLVSEAVNFAAQTDETNGLIYTFKGLTGGYKGLYSVLPYYKKIKEYSAMEQRDMWEYSLDLSHEETLRLLYHLEELGGISSDYYFFTKNCSYNLLWLLEAAKGDTHLPEYFRYKVIPVDTIRLLHEKNLITKTVYRPSKRREMQQLLKGIENIPLTKKFVQTYELKLLDKVNKKQQVKVLDLAVLMLKQERSKQKINKKGYIKTLMKLLRYRSRLPAAERLKVTKPSDPVSGHKSAKFSFWVADHKRWSLQIKPAMHDLYDIATGYLPGAYIDFFKLSIVQSKFRRFDFVSVTSLAKWDRFFQPVSWRVQIGVSRVHGKGIYCSLEGGAGISMAKKAFSSYLLFVPKLYAGKRSHSAVGMEGGIFYDSRFMRIGALVHKDFFDDGIAETGSELFITDKISQNMALNLKLHEDKIDQHSERHLDVGLFYYF